MHDFLLFAGAFLASAVEMVEALTIVLAVGITRGWRSALWGVAVALVALALIVGVLGSALTEIPIDSLRVVVGTVLLIFGLQWLRKAISARAASNRSTTRARSFARRSPRSSTTTGRGTRLVLVHRLVQRVFLEGSRLRSSS